MNKIERESTTVYESVISEQKLNNINEILTSTNPIILLQGELYVEAAEYTYKWLQKSHGVTMKWDFLCDTHELNYFLRYLYESFDPSCALIIILSKTSDGSGDPILRKVFFDQLNINIVELGTSKGKKLVICVPYSLATYISYSIHRNVNELLGTSTKKGIAVHLKNTIKLMLPRITDSIVLLLIRAINNIEIKYPSKIYIILYCLIPKLNILLDEARDTNILTEINIKEILNNNEIIKSDNTIIKLVKSIISDINKHTSKPANELQQISNRRWNIARSSGSVEEFTSTLSDNLIRQDKMAFVDMTRVDQQVFCIPHAARLYRHLAKECNWYKTKTYLETSFTESQIRKFALEKALLQGYMKIKVNSTFSTLKGNLKYVKSYPEPKGNNLNTKLGDHFWTKYVELSEITYFFAKKLV